MFTSGTKPIARSRLAIGSESSTIFLSEHYEKQNNKSISVEELQQQAQNIITLPYISDKASLKSAMFILAVFLSLPYLYLISVCETLHSVLLVTPERKEGGNWIVLQNSRVAFFLTTLWLLAPPTLLASALFSPELGKFIPLKFDFLYVVGGALWLLLLGGVSADREFRARCLFLSR